MRSIVSSYAASCSMSLPSAGWVLPAPEAYLTDASRPPVTGSEIYALPSASFQKTIENTLIHSYYFPSKRLRCQSLLFFYIRKGKRFSRFYTKGLCCGTGQVILIQIQTLPFLRLIRKIFGILCNSLHRSLSFLLYTFCYLLSYANVLFISFVYMLVLTNV